MEDISIVVTILTAMITPAIFIVACGSLSLTTSQRLNRSIERTRKISNEFKEIKMGTKKVSANEAHMLHTQLEKASQRAMLLQMAMTCLYSALGLFIATSLLIGVFEIFHWVRSWILVLLPMLGALALLVASIILILESRLAIIAVNNELKFNLLSSSEYNKTRLEDPKRKEDE